MNLWLIITVIHTTCAVVKLKPEKNSGLNFFCIYLFFSGFNFATAQVVCLTAMINHKFISFSAVQIYDLPYIHLQSLHHLHKPMLELGWLLTTLGSLEESWKK